MISNNPIFTAGTIITWGARADNDLIKEVTTDGYRTEYHSPHVPGECPVRDVLRTGGGPTLVGFNAFEGAVRWSPSFRAWVDTPSPPLAWAEGARVDPSDSVSDQVPAPAVTQPQTSQEWAVPDDMAGIPHPRTSAMLDVLADTDTPSEAGMAVAWCGQLVSAVDNLIRKVEQEGHEPEIIAHLKGIREHGRLCHAATPTRQPRRSQTTSGTEEGDLT